jgi:hypothetical protein
MVVAVIEAIPPIRQRRGRPRRRPAKLQADKAYDSRVCRVWLRARHIQPRMARRGIDSSGRGRRAGVHDLSE